LIDEHFTKAIERYSLHELKIEKYAQGKYMFGGKKINATIQNGKPIIRVGGGSMEIHEFV
jgi:hypothetical protein